MLVAKAVDECLAAVGVKYGITSKRDDSGNPQVGASKGDSK